MSSICRVRAARPDDAERVVEVQRAGFDAAVIDATIYGCHGVARYVADRSGDAASHEATTFTVAERGGEIIGAAEMRLGADGLFLNYVALTREARGQGIGRALLLGAIERSTAVGLSRLGLDVFEDNAAARAWYERLGLQSIASREMWALPLPEPSGGTSSPIDWTPEAESWQRRYGFSSCAVETRTGVITVGRLGTAWFRLTDVAAVADRQLLERLAADAPPRRLLAILGAGLLSDELRHGARRLATTIRMDGPLQPVLERLRSEG